MHTYNFKSEAPAVQPSEYYKGIYRDIRNGINCEDPTGDLQCYLNYIEYLNLHRDKWCNYGYLDLGMIPVAMGPGFMQDKIVQIVVKALSKHDVPHYVMPPVSFMHEVCRMGVDDIWVFREDINKVFGKDKVTMEEIVRWCWDEAYGN